MQTHTEKQKLLEIHWLKLIFLSLFKESHSWVKLQFLLCLITYHSEPRMPEE